MALRGSLTHRKTRWLAELLRVPVPCALGVMEAVWHVTSERTPNGAIGVLSNRDIAAEMFWSDDPDALIEALVEVKILDQHPLHRLVVHGWAERCDQAVRRKVSRRGEAFAGEELATANRTLDVTSHNETALDISSSTSSGSGSGTSSGSSPKPPGGACDEGASSNGHQSQRDEPDWTAYRNALFAHFGREATPKEWDAILTNLRRYEDAGDLPPLPVWADYCLASQLQTRDESGKMPKTSKPILDFLAEAIAERNGQ